MPGDYSLAERIRVEFSGFVQSLPEEIRESFSAIIDDEIATAVEMQRREDLGKAAAALLDSGVKPERGIEILQKYWDISRKHAISLINQEGPARKLEAYLVNRGILESEALALGKQLLKLLKSEPSLSKERMEVQRQRAEKALKEWRLERPSFKGQVHFISE